MTFKAGNEFRMLPGDNRSNGLGRPKTSRTIKKDTMKALRVAAGPLVALAVERALGGSEPALCAVLGLLASGFGEPPAKRVATDGDAPIVG
jgi:hypothetical protein